MSDIDVARDLFDFYYISATDQDKYKMSLSLELKEWTELGMSLKMDLSNPLIASKGDSPDRVALTVKNRQLFKSKASGAVLEQNAVITVDDVPAQLPQGVDEAAVSAEASRASAAFEGAAIL